MKIYIVCISIFATFTAYSSSNDICTQGTCGPRTAFYHSNTDQLNNIDQVTRTIMHNSLQDALDTGTKPSIHQSPEDIECFLKTCFDYQTLIRLTAYINERYTPLKTCNGSARDGYAVEEERCYLFNLLQDSAKKANRMSNPKLLKITTQNLSLERFSSKTKQA